jgi:hypothetical protein
MKCAVAIVRAVAVQPEAILYERNRRKPEELEMGSRPLQHFVLPNN